MKLITAFLFLLSTFVVNQDVEAQTRGPRYNPNPGGSGGSSPSRSGGSSTPSRSGGSSTPRGPSYNPNPDRGSSTPSRPSSGGTYTPSRPSTPSTGSTVGGSTPRGPRYNPNPGSGTPSTPSRPSTGGTYTPSRPSPGSTVGGSTPRGPRYNPNPGNGTPSRPGPVVNRPNPGSTPRGPRYNPNPNTNPRNPGRVVTRPGTTQPRYYPRPTSPTYRVPGQRYNRPAPGRTVYHRPIRTHYGTRYYHRPYGHTPIRYSHYYHAPYRSPYYHTVRYYRSYDWYNYVYRVNRNYVYAHWIFYPANGYSNGYRTIDNYPYYVYNGYRYRYSNNDYCNYQLVDSNNHNVVQTYWNQSCNTGYDACSYERDRLNAQMNDYRYFCSETWRDYGYDYSTPSYDETGYPTSTDSDYDYDDYTCTDANRDGMCDDYSNTCSDYDNDGYCDPGTYSPEYSEAI
jgi:hypothetical protein